MIEEFNKSQFEYFLDCLKNFKLTKYYEKFKNEVVIDTAISDLGFKREPTYTIDFDMDENDLSKTLKELDNIYKTDYDLFDEYSEFYNLLKELHNEHKRSKMEEHNLKCASCGANLKAEEKYCSYCGSLNPQYKEKTIKDVEIPKNEENVSSDDDLGDLFGGFLGGVMMGSAMRGFGRFMGERRHPPRRR